MLLRIPPERTSLVRADGAEGPDGASHVHDDRRLIAA
jgi:hypothetical protein